MDAVDEIIAAAKQASLAWRAAADTALRAAAEQRAAEQAAADALHAAEQVAWRAAADALHAAEQATAGGDGGGRRAI